MADATAIIKTYPIWSLARKELDVCDDFSKDHFASGAVWGKATTMRALGYACKELGIDIMLQLDLERMIEKRIQQAKEGGAS